MENKLFNNNNNKNNNSLIGLRVNSMHHIAGTELPQLNSSCTTY